MNGAGEQSGPDSRLPSSLPRHRCCNGLRGRRAALLKIRYERHDEPLCRKHTGTHPFRNRKTLAAAAIPIDLRDYPWSTLDAKTALKIHTLLPFPPGKV
jgi:hypothetical protein